MSKTPAPRPGPVVIEMDSAAQETPDTAPPVPERDASGGELTADPALTGQTMQTLAALAARKPSLLVRLFLASLVAFVGLTASIMAWDFVAGLLERMPVLGWAATGLAGVLVLSLLGLALREVLALSRMRRIDGLRGAAETALAAQDLKAARQAAGQLISFYNQRPELADAREQVNRQLEDQFDADGLIGVLDQHLMAPLDAAARGEIESAARQVAAVTTVVPIALADLAVALTANLRMIRRISEIYGGRSGTLGSWRLTRAVLTHLVATGAVAVGDDLIGSVAGAGVMSRLSRRFGEGIVNGALTARVGVAAMDVCRPVPYVVEARPKISGLVKRALTGLFPARGG
ncbi:MAG: TIGR01620 family protein [Litoreibacter sp.]|nr:TIGR01620 family protein [Litoreibacter sp.]